MSAAIAISTGEQRAFHSEKSSAQEISTGRGVAPLPPAPKPQLFPRPTGQPNISTGSELCGRVVQRLEKGLEKGGSLLKVTQPSWSTAHRCLLPPQFLRNSLKKTRGSNWSLRLSKELNNQIESFDSPSLEKVGPLSVRAVQTGRGLKRCWNGEAYTVCESSCTVYRVLGREVGGPDE